jgi:ribosomal silencing factor RsfS
MKKLSGNEFELRKDANKMLEMVQSEFGGIGQCENDSNEIWAVIDCNGFETVSLSYDEQREIYSLDVTNCYWGRGEDILNFIEENRQYVL